MDGQERVGIPRKLFDVRSGKDGFFYVVVLNMSLVENYLVMNDELRKYSAHCPCGAHQKSWPRYLIDHLLYMPKGCLHGSCPSWDNFCIAKAAYDSPKKTT